MKGLSLCFTFLVATTGAWATVLTFESDLGTSLSLNNFSIAPLYGNRVSAAVENGFSYGVGNGTTAGIAVSYSATSSSQAAGWATDYGDLVNVLWGNGPNSATNEVSIHFAADPGLVVEFRGLDVARWSTGVYPGSYVTITNAANVTTTLLSSTVLPDGPVHTSLDYDSSPLVSTEFTLTFGNAWWTAVDNVSFTQNAVPEPASMVVLGLGVVAAARRRRSGK